MKDAAFTGAGARPGTAVTVRGGTWPGTSRPAVRDGPDGPAARDELRDVQASAYRVVKDIAEDGPFSGDGVGGCAVSV